VKGSPEKILAGSSHMLIGEKSVLIDRKTIETQFNDLARQG
jgi:hypothetical protein